MKMKATLLTALIFPTLPWALHAAEPRTLNADGRTDTYQLIEAHGYGVEVPDCGHPVKHITQQFDSTLGKHVLAFTLHADIDDDRCGAKDRQRAEIKTFGPSPDNMKGMRGQTVRYRWRFRLPEDFRPSPRFCHIHQIKADSGPEAGAPVVTLTPRVLTGEGGREVMQFMIVDADNRSTIVSQVDLAPFKGEWVEVEETMLHDSDGWIEMTVRRLSDGRELLRGRHEDFNFWRLDARFNRPKYGIYRSLLEREYLRDETVLFSDIEYITLEDRYPGARRSWDPDRAVQIEQRVGERPPGSVTVNAVDFGARGDNLKDNTAGFNLAIDVCAEAGGGRVFVPEGIYRVNGSMRLASGVELRLASGALILLQGAGASLGAMDVERIALTGEGRIDGEVRFSDCRELLIRGITITGDAGALTLVDCRDVVVDGCELSAEGDIVSLDATDRCEDVVIRECRFGRSRCSALVVGRNSSGRIGDLFLHGSVFGEIAENLVRIAPAADPRTVVEDVWMSDCRSEGYPCRTAFRVEQPAAETRILYCYFDRFEGINATESGVAITSAPRSLRPVESLWFRDIQITGTPYLLAGSGGRDIYTHNVGALPQDLPGQRHVFPAVAGARLDYTPGIAPDHWSVAAARTVMVRWPDYSQAYFNAWTYVNGYLACALERLWKATGDEAYIRYIKNYIDPFIEADGNFAATTNNKGIAPVPSYCNNLDGMMTGNTLVMLYEHYGEERYRLAADRIAECMKEYPRNDDGGFWHGTGLHGQMWIDGIFMGQMFLLRYGRSIGEARWSWDEAVRQITAYARRGEQGSSGLYVHGIYEPGHGDRPCAWADQATGKSPEVWGEGLGWYALALVEALETIPRSHKGYRNVKDIFERLAAGLKRTQDSLTGGWYQVVDKGHLPDNWIETSGTAMFTYALQKGIELGILNEKEYRPVTEAGYRSITAHAVVNADGLVDIYEACDGLGVQDSYAKYIDCARYAINAKEAVVGFVWATEIMERESLKNYR